MSEPLHIYPMMPLRDLVLFPHMVAPLVVGRAKSIKALEDAMANRKKIFLVTQKDSTVDDPSDDDLYQTGTIASVLQLLRLPDGTIKALVEGKFRGKIQEIIEQEDFAAVLADEYHDDDYDKELATAYIREISTSFKEYAARNKKVSNEIVKSIAKINDPGKFVDFLAAHLPVGSDKKQNLLNAVALIPRMEEILALIHHESQIAGLEAKIRGKVKKKLDQTQKNYYLNEQVKVINKEIGGDNDPDSDMAELEKKISVKKMAKSIKDKCHRELKKLKQMSPMSAEATVVRNYIDAILTLPWQKKTKSTINIDKAEEILNEDHFGLKVPKERILEYLAVQTQVKKIKGPILCLVGPPGVGKTSLSKSVARAMGRKFVRLSLGGVRDEAEIRGHRRTYIGAMPGKIIQSLQKAKVNNPVFCLDEIDKMSMDFRGDPSSALLEVLDPEQNNAFNVHYLDLDYDLSDIFFITTANNLPAIPPPLRDRMEVIKLSGYTEEDKLQIAQGFLIPKQLSENGFSESEITFSANALLDVIRRYTREAGVRNLERSIASLCRKVARDRLQKDIKRNYRIGATSIAKFLGIPKFRFGETELKDEIGLATGLAWTEVGGELLQIETVLMPGNGKLTITGKLGDVMQESARAAMSYVRTRARRLGLNPEFYQKIDIHIHVPEGAIPKDGPSAGITMATSMVSALLRLPVRKDIAMTGEITLRGRVLPIGGLTEKLLAARRGNVRQVMIPKDNKHNLQEIPAKIARSLDIELVDNMDDVLQRSLVVKDGESLFQAVTDETFCLDLPVLAASTDHQPHH